jgi:hypothetical protein
MPDSVSSPSAHRKHSTRTAQPAQTAFAGAVGSPRVGKKFTSGCSRHAASFCQRGSRNLTKAFERARLAEEANPTPPGLERENYQLAAYMVKRASDGADGDYSDSFDNIVFGRFVQDVGGHLLAMHPECAEITADRS